MDQAVPAIVAFAVVAFALVSKRLGHSVLTGTMVFAAVGLLMSPELFDLAGRAGELGAEPLVSTLLTGTLIVVLFTDASAINASNWRDDVIPARLLGIGLPLAIVFGWIAAMFVLGELEMWEAAVLATMLAPTDAALGKSVVSNPRVPKRIRQALNIESGLNDGIALPLFLVFVDTAEAVEQSLDAWDLVTELVWDVGIAVAVGVAVGAAGARALRWANRAGTAFGYWLQIAFFALAVLAYSITDPLGGSGFIAAWVAGLVLGRSIRDRGGDDSLPMFAETAGDLLTMLSFLIFGVFLGPVLANLTWQIVVYGVLSLTVVRGTAVGISMLRGGLRRPSLVYLGWFGPRGLATIILAIEIVDGSSLTNASAIANTALFTVGLSVLAHGVTAWWGSNAYADYCESHPLAGAMAEDEMPTVAVRVPLRSQHHGMSSNP